MNFVELLLASKYDVEFSKKAAKIRFNVKLPKGRKEKRLASKERFQMFGKFLDLPWAYPWWRYLIELQHIIKYIYLEDIYEKL